MMPVFVSDRRFENICVSTNTDSAMEEKKSIAAELKEWNDAHRDPQEVARYVALELPIVIKTLKEGEPSFRRDSPEQVRIRRTDSSSSDCNALFSPSEQPYSPYSTVFHTAMG